MIKRYLSLSSSEIKKLTAKQLLESIKKSEGRILVSENIVTLQPLLQNITNSELACSFGADLILLNLFDVQNPKILGMPNNINTNNIINELKKLTGRSIGVNLEPVDKDFKIKNEEFWSITNGRYATKENALKLVDMNIDFITLTGNPNNGIRNKSIINSLEEIKNTVKDQVVLIAGKMHAAGILENIINKNDIDDFVKAGADIILLPAPGTIPSMDLNKAKDLIDHIHNNNILAMTAIGTSQEGADVDTIKQIALMAKMAGADLHHIGDTGLPGIALPENIKAYSIAIRGIRHTYNRMASSINR